MWTMVQRNVALRVRVGAHAMAAPHPGRALFPSGFAPEDVVDYYRAITPVLIRHLAGRTVTIQSRDGAEARGLMVFPAEPTRADGTALAMAAATKGLEIRVSPWKVADARDSATGSRAIRRKRLVDRLVFALVPEPWEGMLACRETALNLRDRLAADGLTPVVKTSGSTVLHVWVALRPTEVPAAVGYATAIASNLTANNPGRVLPLPISTSPYGPPGVLNESHRGIDVDVASAEVSAIAPYSLRHWEVVHRTGRSGPAISAPVTWRELEYAESAAELSFEPWEVVARLQRDGDHFAPVLNPPGAAKK